MAGAERSFHEEFGRAGRTRTSFAPSFNRVVVAVFLIVAGWPALRN